MQENPIKKLSTHLDVMQSVLDEIRIKIDFASMSKNLDFDSCETTHQAAQRLFEDRRVRSSHFVDENLFGEPAWDILLDIYIHQVQDDDVSVKSACVGSGVPATTALRWLKVLEEMSLILSESDPNDQRRRFVRLTPKGYDAMTRYLRAISRRR